VYPEQETSVTAGDHNIDPEIVFSPCAINRISRAARG
jgi:hypothetical protein